MTTKFSLFIRLIALLALLVTLAACARTPEPLNSAAASTQEAVLTAMPTPGRPHMEDIGACDPDTLIREDFEPRPIEPRPSDPPPDHSADSDSGGQSAERRAGAGFDAIHVSLI